MVVRRQFIHAGVPGFDLAALLTRALVDYPEPPPTEGSPTNFGRSGLVEPRWGCRLYTYEAQQELLGLYHAAVLEAAPEGTAEEFTMERLEEEYAIGCIAWYEIQVGAGVTVLADPKLEAEKVEFFRHVMARNKIIVTATGATKLVQRLAAEAEAPQPVEGPAACKGCGHVFCGEATADDEADDDPDPCGMAVEGPEGRKRLCCQCFARGRGDSGHGWWAG